MALLSVKTRNLFKNYGYECHLSNIKINGEKRGCSGFIVNPRNGKIVYINTESSCFAPLARKVLYRYAKDLKDYSGGRNQFCFPEELQASVSKLLETPDERNQKWDMFIPDAIKVAQEKLKAIYGNLVYNLYFQHVDIAGYWFSYSLINDERVQILGIRHEEVN